MPSWWNSLESVNTVKGWLDLTVLITGLVTAAGAVLIWVVGNRVSTLQGEKDAELRTRMEAAEGRIRPRRLTAEQRDKFLAILAANPKGSVLMGSVLGDDESFNFATELEELLAKSGWKIVNHSRGVFGPPLPVGIEIRVYSEASVPPEAYVLLKALPEIGLKATPTKDEGIKEMTVKLLIGSKPPE